ncbi:helix-turn-helix transcriptional regulator [Pseudomonas veronii]|uniref:helix-turn-helix domain-containing protein n=1 Tax=Pseudomonas veronii TaxID=76761 RepID=UPI0015A34D6E|nr:helix-turn-helix transcriptional regulator [Pseudomonas veronii]NWD57161.1 helix-turn-helix transcriptional regulator [Pseudomonas veronii]
MQALSRPNHHKGYISERADELLKGIGSGIEIARQRRRLKISTICSRAGITRQTYQRLRQGEAGVSLGVLMNVLSALDLEEGMASIAAPELDQVGITMSLAREPDRIRIEGAPNVLEADW